MPSPKARSLRPGACLPLGEDARPAWTHTFTTHTHTLSLLISLPSWAHEGKGTVRANRVRPRLDRPSHRRPDAEREKERLAPNSSRRRPALRYPNVLLRCAFSVQTADHRPQTTDSSSDHDSRPRPGRACSRIKSLPPIAASRTSLARKLRSPVPSPSSAPSITAAATTTRTAAIPQCEVDDSWP